MDSDQLKLGIPRNDGQLSIIFNKGGAREGAGKKRLGITKKVSLTLTTEIWKKIKSACDEKNSSQSEILRNIITSYYSENYN